MAKAIITRPNDVAALDGGTWLATAPLANVLDDQPTDFARSTALTNVFGRLDFGAAVTLDTFALMYTNATAAATLRLRGGASQVEVDGAAPFDTTVTLWASPGIKDAQPHGLIWLDTPETHRWWRFDVADGANPDGFIDIGRIVAGEAIRVGHAYGAGHGVEDAGVVAQADISGITIPTVGGKVPTLSWRIPFESEAQMVGEVLPLQRAVGETGPVLVCLNPDQADAYRHYKMYYGLMDLRGRIVNRSLGLYEQRLQITAMI